MQAYISDRLSRFRFFLETKEIEAALITDPKNILYLSNYAFEDGGLLILMNDAYLITDFRYEEEAKAFADGAFTVVTPPNKNSFIDDILKQNSSKCLGYESGTMTVEDFRVLDAALAATLLPLGNLLTQMRAIKDTRELEAIRFAHGIAERSFLELMERLTPKMTEEEVAVELEYLMRRNGAQGASFDTIAVSGTSSALPHGKCRKTMLSSGFLTIDFGCVYQGYCSDTTRTLCIGRASEEMKHLYHTVLTAQEAAISCIREGITGASVDAVARAIIEKDYPSAFGHSLGHGVGLHVHESPRLSPSATDILLCEGNVVTVEPGIYLNGRYGCRIEDMGCVLKEGFENFTTLSKDLVELFA